MKPSKIEDMISRRTFLENCAAAGVFTTLGPRLLAAPNDMAAETPAASAHELRFVLDMVHDNPGEPPFVTKFKDAAVLKSWGYTGQVPRTFVQTAITYDSFDPEVLPWGSTAREWSERMGTETVDCLLAMAKAGGLPLYPFTDVLVVPKALMQKHRAELYDGSRLSILKPMTQKVMRAQINEVFERFPGLGGLTIRFGETYLQDTPNHVGGSPVASVGEHQALISLLREEVCVKRNKVVLYRTWSWGGIELHTNPGSYLKVTDAIEPHAKLRFSIKHSAGDFLRNIPFNATLGIGKHKQIVEVSCNSAGVYGKNAHPYYIGQGVIEGWEEMKTKKGLRDLVGSPQLDGVWTWSRGDGWAGPYIANEFWVNLNAWVISQWGQNPARTEPELFDAYVRTKLKLRAADIAQFRRLCLLATSATFHGQQSSFFNVNPWWCRDQYLTAVNLTEVIKKDLVEPVLAEKAKAVADWRKVEAMSRAIHLSNPDDQEFLEVSATYGRIKFAIIQQLWILQILTAGAKAGKKRDAAAMKRALDTYDKLWVEWRQLKDQHACCPTLYTDARAVHCGPPFQTVLVPLKKQPGM